MSLSDHGPHIIPLLLPFNDLIVAGALFVVERTGPLWSCLPMLATDEQPYTVISAREDTALLLLCDHASNHVPPDYDGLGLDPALFERHIAYDIGAADVTRSLAELSGAGAVLAGFSRLLIDPNRGADDPTLVMKLSDGAIIPGNRHADAGEVADRVARFYGPYHDQVAAALAAIRTRGQVPIIVSIHSFTPHFQNKGREWPIALLWDKDDRLAAPLKSALEAAFSPVGDNQPYDGALKNDCMYKHGTANGYPHVLIEIRQDLIDQPDKAAVISEKIWSVLRPLLDLPALARVEHVGSRTDDISF